LEPSQHTGWEERRPNARGARRERHRSGWGGAAGAQDDGAGTEQDESGP
jgi:hypothetical protein